jgi:hypothetical protein
MAKINYVDIKKWVKKGKKWMVVHFYDFLTERIDV